MRGDCRSFHTIACSRPPLPRTSTFIRRASRTIPSNQLRRTMRKERVGLLRMACQTLRPGEIEYGSQLQRRADVDRTDGRVSTRTDQKRHWISAAQLRAEECRGCRPSFARGHAQHGRRAAPPGRLLAAVAGLRRAGHPGQRRLHGPGQLGHRPAGGRAVQVRPALGRRRWPA